MELAAINCLVDRFPTDPQLHRAFLLKYLRKEHLQQLKKKLSIPEQRPPDAYVVLNRVCVLVALKAIIGIEGTPDGTADAKLIGDILLAMNDITQSRNPPSDDLELSLMLLPTWELTNPRDLAYALSRTVMMIRNYVNGNDQQIQKLRKALGLDLQTMQYDGLSMEDFIAVVFGIFAYANGLTPADVLTGKKQYIIEKTALLSKTKFSTTVLDEFLKQRSVTLKALRPKITGDPSWTLDDARAQFTSKLFSADFLAFREHPIIDLENDKYLILDLQFLAELLFNGLYFDVFHFLPKKKRTHFTSLWGRAFELYVDDLLDHFYQPMSGILQKDVTYENGQIDAILDFGSYVVLIETKFFLLEHNAKFSRNKEEFERQLKLKIVQNQRGEKKGVRQLADIATAILEQKVKNISGKRPIYQYYWYQKQA